MSIVMGYALNAVFSITGTQSLDKLLVQHFCRHTSAWQLALSGIFLVILLFSFYRLLVPKIKGLSGMNKSGGKEHPLTIKVSGMSCKNCARKVTEAVNKVTGVKEVEVNVKKGTVRVEGSTRVEEIKKAIEDAGYKVK
jgi:copper ion binding protein